MPFAASAGYGWTCGSASREGWPVPEDCTIMPVSVAGAAEVFNYEATTTRSAPLRRCKAEWDLLPLAVEHDFLPIG